MKFRLTQRHQDSLEVLLKKALEEKKPAVGYGRWTKEFFCLTNQLHNQDFNVDDYCIRYRIARDYQTQKKQEANKGDEN